MDPGSISGTGAQSFCVSGNPSNIISSSPGNNGLPSIPNTNITYKWEFSTDNINWIIISGVNLSSYDPPTNVNVTTYYRRTLVVTIGNNLPCSSLPSNVVSFIVNSNPNVDFTFTNNQCSGSTIQFNTNSIGTTYTWNFGDSTSSTQQNPTHIFNSTGCGTQDFSVSLTVIDANGCSNTIIKTITIKQAPNAIFKDASVPYTPLNLSNQFNNCQSAGAANPVYNVSVAIHQSSSCISNYTINWGDGSTLQTFSAPPFTHSYTALGAYTMSITALGSNGCTVTKNYIVKNESNPAGGLVSPGNTTNLCAPTPNLAFTISNWASNSPGTSYVLDYGDGSPLITLTQPDLINSIYYNPTNPNLSQNYPVPHSYNSSSCPNPSITARLTISNSCGTTESTINPITILKPATPNFNGPTNACVNSCVTFTNLSTSALNENCAINTYYSWDFGDGTSIYEVTSSGTRMSSKKIL
jgi:hypothetical protein